MRAPREDDLESTRWALEDGHTFWSYVDSTPGAYRTYGHSEECHSGYGNNTCHLWAHARADNQCIAANSRLERCSSWGTTGAPFCHFHLERAMRVLLVQLAESERDLLARDIDRIRLAGDQRREELLRHLQVETSLIWDAANAAARLAERVYFFAADYAVKIGRSTNPERRVRSLSGTKAPADINVRAGSLLGTIPGGSRTEGDLHSRFARHRLVGEWFEFEPISADIHALIADAQERAA